MLASASYTITSLIDGLTVFYRYVRTTSNTTVPTSGWSSTMPASQPGYFIWRQEGIALSFDEVNSWGNPMCLTGATGSKGDPGVPGTDGPAAQDFSIDISSPTFSLSSRGMVTETQTLLVSCKLLNINLAEVSIGWAIVGEVSLSNETGQDTQVSIASGTIATSFTIQCSVSGYGVKTLTVKGVRSGEPSLMYLGVLDEQGQQALQNGMTTEGPFIMGDYYLSDNMEPFYYSGESEPWVLADSNTPNIAQITMGVLHDALQNVDTIPSGSYLYLYVESLGVNSITAKKITVTEESLGSLKITADNIDLESIEKQNLKMDSSGSISGNYRAGISGWKVNGSGHAEFNDIEVRGISELTGQVNNQALQTYLEQTGLQVANPETGAITGPWVAVNDLWRKDAFYDAILDFNGTKSNLITESGIFGDKTISKLALQTGNHLFYEDLASHAVTVNAGGTYNLFDYTVPSTVGVCGYFVGSASLGGTMNEIYYTIYRNGSWMDFSNSCQGIVLPGDVVRLRAKSWAWWGSQTGSNNYFKVYDQFERNVTQLLATLGSMTLNSDSANNSKSLTFASSIVPVGVTIVAVVISYVSIPEALLGLLAIVVDGVTKVTVTSPGKYWLSVSEGQTVSIAASTSTRVSKSDDGSKNYTYGSVLVRNAMICATTKGGLNTPGVQLYYSDNSSEFLNRNNTGYSQYSLLQLTIGNIFLSGSCLSMKSGDQIISKFDSLTKDNWLQLASEDINVDSILKNGILFNPISVKVTSSLLQFRDIDLNIVEFSRLGYGDGGYYSSAEIKVVVAGQSKRIETASLNPKVPNFFNIGESNNRYQKGWLNELDATLITGTTVWGAVAN